MTSHLAIEPETQAHTMRFEKNAWVASLGLEFSLTSRGSQLVRTKRNGPLSVQKAFYPEGPECAHIYLLHPPAGIVSGDDLTIEIKVNEHAHCVVTTPGANRFYRAREDHNIGDPKQMQHSQISLSPHAKCENFPLETIVYEGALGFNTVDIKLSANSVYLGWDITCLGLPYSKQPFVNGSYSQLNRIYCDDKLLYHDRLAIHPSSQIHSHLAGLNRHDVFASLIAYAPSSVICDESRKVLLAELRDTIELKQASKKVSVTHIRQLLVIRYLGDHAEECKALFILLWQKIRPRYLNKQAIMPRVWFT